MVNRGVSRGCITCKKRHVKCDETKPSCKACNRVGRQCAGYGKQPPRVRFKDETARYLDKCRPPIHTTNTNIADFGGPNGTKTACAHRHIGVTVSLQPKQQDTAFAFFLTYVTDIGRSMESTRGFLELVRPVLANESVDSALYAAVNATSIKLWALLRPYDVADSLPIKMYNQALGKLQQAVHSHEERGKDATVIAALMLQQHDTLAAIFGHNTSNTTHRKGAFALLTQESIKRAGSKYHGHLLGNILHSKVSFCVRHKVPLTASEINWFQRTVVPALPNSPSYILDIIGVSVSKLQATVSESASCSEDIALSALQELPFSICDIEVQLQRWLSTVPKTWHPRTLTRDHVHPSIENYDGSVDVYPSIQIANIWNVWRMYRLTVEQAKVTLFSNAVTEDRDKCAQNLKERQKLIGAICRSLPFYLGSCSRPVSFNDITDQQPFFPSYHDLALTDESFITYKKSHHYASRTDHNRHNVIHGPLAALNVISNLVGLYQSSLPQSSLLKDELQGQEEWIGRQFHRSLYLMRFVSSEHMSASVGFQNHMSQAQMHQRLADTIRQALFTVNLL